ncbi:MAG: damage-control phosphatase ARMT1 family protein [Oceanipulchritudo sp.]
MKTALDCYGCFMRQGLQTARLAGATEAQQGEVLRELMRHLLSVEGLDSPVFVVREMQRIVSRITGVDDPYAEIKSRNNQLAREWIGTVSKRFTDPSGDSLDHALRLSIAGNIIDYGPSDRFDLEGTLERCLAQPMAIDHGKRLEQRLSEATSLAFLADNAGEIVFDFRLLSLLKRRFALDRILVVVREEAFLNDALERDALEAGFGALAGVEIVRMGPGKPPPGSRGWEVWQRITASDMRLAKGQANAEAYNEEADFFLLFMVKCDLVARVISAGGPNPVRTGDMVLVHTAAP